MGDNRRAPGHQISVWQENPDSMEQDRRLRHLEHPVSGTDIGRYQRCRERNIGDADSVQTHDGATELQIRWGHILHLGRHERHEPGRTA